MQWLPRVPSRTLIHCGGEDCPGELLRAAEILLPMASHTSRTTTCIKISSDNVPIPCATDMATITGKGRGTTSEKAISAKATSANTHAQRTRLSIFAVIVAFFSDKLGVVMVCLPMRWPPFVQRDEGAARYDNLRPHTKLDLL